MATLINAGLRDSAEHLVTLRYSFFRSKGLDLTMADAGTLCVNKLDSNGLIGDWNRENPEAQVQVGDSIVDVNGKKGDSRAMLEEAKSSLNLRLLVRRNSDPRQQIHLLQFRDLGPDDFEILGLLDDMNPRRSTVPKKQLQALPRLQASLCRSSSCLVCLKDFGPDDMVTQLPCQHAYCTPCIEAWLTRCRSDCPTCHASVAEHLAAATTVSASVPLRRDCNDESESAASEHPVVCDEVENGGSLIGTPPPILRIGGATRGLFARKCKELDVVSVQL